MKIIFVPPTTTTNQGYGRNHQFIGKSASDQSSQIAKLQDTIDNMSIQQWDMEEKNNYLTVKLCELETKLEGCYAIQSKYEKTKERDDADNNAHYAKLREELESLKSSKVNDEHMAKKLIQLATHNVWLKEQLAQSRLNEFETCQQAIIQDPPTEIKKFQEQVTGFINERAKYDCQLFAPNSTPCGHCTSCQLINLRKSSELHTNYYTNVIKTLMDGLKSIANISWWWNMHKALPIVSSTIYKAKTIPNPTTELLS